MPLILHKLNIMDCEIWVPFSTVLKLWQAWCTEVITELLHLQPHGPTESFWVDTKNRPNPILLLALAGKLGSAAIPMAFLFSPLQQLV